MNALKNLSQTCEPSVNPKLLLDGILRQDHPTDEKWRRYLTEKVWPSALIDLEGDDRICRFIPAIGLEIGCATALWYTFWGQLKCCLILVTVIRHHHHFWQYGSPARSSTEPRDNTDKSRRGNTRNRTRKWRRATNLGGSKLSNFRDAADSRICMLF